MTTTTNTVTFTFSAGAPVAMTMPTAQANACLSTFNSYLDALASGSFASGLLSTSAGCTINLAHVAMVAIS
jgi:hypothetical protein